SFVHIPIYRGTAGVVDGEDSPAYNQFIGAAHAHQWCGGGASHHSCTLFGGNYRVGCGSCTFGPWLPCQRELTRIALSILPVLKDQPLEIRKAIYEQIVNAPDLEAWVEISRLYSEA